MVYFLVEDAENKGLCELLQFLKNNKDIPLFKHSKIKCVNGFNNFKNMLDDINFRNRQEDIFILFMDRVYDNDLVMQRYNTILDMIEDSDNVFLSDIICFEYLLLTFEKFEDWVIGNKYKDKLSKDLIFRDELIKCVDAGIFWYSSKILLNMVENWIQNLKGGDRRSENSTEKCVLRIINGVVKVGYINDKNKFIPYRSIGVEVIANIILTKITRNSVFKASKLKLGDCWTNECYNDDTEVCDKGEWGKHVCNITDKRLSKRDKADILYAYSYLGELCELANKKLSQ